MRILLVSHFFPPTHNAGAEKRTLGYALALQRLGHSVQVACAGEWEKGSQHWNGFTDEVYQGVPVRRAQLNWSAAPDPNRSLYDNPLIEARFEQWLDEWQPDVVHIISLLTLSGSVARAVKRRGLPVIFTLTDFWLVCPKISLVRGDGSLCDGLTTPWECLRCLLWETRAYRALSRALPGPLAEQALTWASRVPAVSRRRGLRGMALDMADRKRSMAELAPMFDAVTAPSTFLARVIDASGLLPEPVRVIHSGHDLSWLKDLPPQALAAGGPRLGYIGQVIPVKGVKMLVEAFQAARAGERGASLRIFGDERADPAYAAAVREMARPSDGTVPSDGITFEGAFPHHQLGAVLSRLDALVVPSQWHENNPRVIQEAFAAKVPVIASDVGGIAEFVQHEVNGLLFAHDDPAGLRAQIERLLADPGLVERLRAGIGPVKTIDQEMEAFVDLYQTVSAIRAPVVK